MSPASHMVGRLRRLYGIVLDRMRGLDGRRGRGGGDSSAPMSISILEPLEPRVLLSVSPLGSALSVSAPVGAWAYPTDILQAISPDINSPPGGAFTPSQIRSAYGMDQVFFGLTAGDGTGQTVAVVDPYDYPTALNDLNQFSLQFGLPQFNVTGGPTFTKVGQTGGAVPGTDPAGPGASQSWELEEALDIEWVHAMAPQANILLVEANSTSISDLIQTAVPWAASQPGVVAVSMSFSGGEFFGETSYDSYFTTPLGHAGVTFFAATGDTGEPAGYPAYSPNVVAVGGTSLTLSGSAYQGETGWSGSGGGISLYESQPSYQQGVVTQSSAYRTAPDVAMDANPGTGVAIYDSYDYPSNPWLQIGGTSLATPLWAGLMAVVDQGRSLAGLSSLDGATQTLPALYKLPAADFHDITSGSNGYSAGPGYDLVTGLGSPVANKLIPALAGQAFELAFARQPATSAAGAVIGGAGGVQVAVEDVTGDTVPGDTSSVTLTLNGGTFASGGNTVTVSAANGIATFNNLIVNAPGAYTLTASDGALAGAVSQGFIIFGAAAKLGFTQQPTSALAGAVISPALAVAVQDSLGDTVATDGSTVTLTLGGGTFASGGNTVTASAVNGIATFGNLRINVTGNYTLTASDGSLTGATSSIFAIMPLSPTVVSIDYENPAGGVAGGASVTYAVTFSEPVTGVTAADFQLALTGGTTASSTVVVSPGSGYNSVYNVTVNGISGNGTVGLNLVDNGSILNQAGNHLANAGGTFQAQKTFAVGSYPCSVTTADVNGDGKPDLIVANENSNTVSVLLGNGNGTFQAQKTYAVGSYPVYVTTADVNGDGKLDLVVANLLNNNVSVLLGNGDGTFQAQKTYAVGSYPACVCVSDVNGDGRPDLVAANLLGSTLSVLLGNGDGTFQAQKTFATGSYPYSVAVADVNGDGKPDLAVANAGGNNVGVLLGNGDGTFQAQKTFATGSFPYAVAVSDVNGDGKPDLVVVNNESNNVGILLGNGDGTFQAQKTFATGLYPYSVAVSDVNGDGKPDLVVANANSNNVGILLGNGDGTFQAQATFATGSYPFSVAVADVNGDGKPDLVVANQSDNTVGVLLGNNSFTGQVYTMNQTDQPTQLAFTQPPTGAVAGNAINSPSGVQVAVEDSGGATVSTDSSLVTLTLSGGTFAGGGTTATVAAVSGIATFGSLIIDASGSYTLTAGDGTLTGATSSSFTISAASAAKLAFTQGPTDGTAGVALSPALTVAVQDQFGNRVTTDSSTVTLTLGGGTFAGGGTTATVAAVSGVATFGSLIIDASGSYTLTAGDGTLTGATSGSFTISAASAAKLAFAQGPTSAVAGTAVSPAVTVAVQDQFGNTVTTDSSTVTLTLGGGTFASGGNTAMIAVVNGIAMFGSLVIDASGGYTLTAGDAALMGATSGSFTISAASAAKLAFTQGPTSGTAGVALSPAVAVTVQDQFGNRVTTDSSTVTLTLGGGTFAGGGTTAAIAAVNGIATFGSLVIDSSGSYTLTASDAALTGATSSSFTISAASASKLAFTQGPTSTVAGTAIAPAVTVTVQDQLGNTVSTDSSTVTLTLGGGTFAGGGTTATIAAVSGIATFGSLIIDASGSYTLTAGDGTLTGATSGSFTISAASAAKLAFTQGPTSGTAGMALSPALTVAVKDQFGNRVTTDSSTVTLTLGGGTFASGGTTATIAAVNGIATFGSLVIDSSGSYTLTAGDGTLTGATSGSFTISAASAAKLAFTQGPTGATAGVALSPAVAVTVQDQFGNTVTTNNSTVTLTLGGGTFAGGGTTATASAAGGIATFGNLVIDASGSYNLTACDGALTGATSSSFTISAASASKLAFAQQPTGAVAGTALYPALTVAVQDAFGNTVTTDSSSVTITLSGGTFASGGNTATTSVVNGIATFGSLVIDASGSYTLTAGDGALTGATSSSFTISAASAAKLAFAQGPTSATAGVALSPAVAVTVQDQFGNTVTTDNSTVTLTLGGGTFAGGGTTVTIAAVNGIATFGSLVIDASGSYTLTAGDSALTGATSGSFTISAASAAKLAFAQGPTSTVAGTAIAPAVTIAVQDQFGNTVTTDNSTVTLTLGGGTFAGGGTTVTIAAVNGIATFGSLVIDASGSYTLTAGDSALTGATSGSFTISAASAAKLAFTQQPAGGTAGVALSPAIAVAVQDSFGNTVGTDSSPVTLTLSGGTFADGGTTATMSAVNGIATFGSLVIDASGSYTLTAGDGTLTGATSGSFTISAASAAKLAFTQGLTSTVAGTAIAPAVTIAVQDSFGNTVTTDSSSVTITLSSGTFASGDNTATAPAAGGIATFGNLIISDAGSYTLTAGDGSLTGATSGSFTNLAPPTVASVSPNIGPAGSGTQVTITGANLTGATAVDFGGAPASGFVVDSDTQITATSPAGQAGTVDVTVVGLGGTSAPSSADQFTYVAAPAVTASAGSLSYLQGAAPGAVDPGITVSDAGIATLAGATVTISGNYAAGQDVLGFANQNGISGSWNAATGVLTLSGISSVANYQAALQSVTYIDTSSSPGTLVRTVSFVADNGFSVNNLSVAASRTVTVTRRSYVDLTGTFGTLWTLSSSIVGGKPLAGYTSVVVKNIGNKALPVGQLVNIQVVAYDTTNPANPDILLATLSKQSVSALAAGGTRQFNVYVSKTTGLPADVYQILANITPVQTLAESRTDNNQASQTVAGAAKAVTAATPFVDLMGQFGVTMKLPASDTSGDGKQMYVPVVAKNIGNVALPVGQKINIAIDADNNGVMTLLKTLTGLSVSSLGPNASAAFGAYVTLPLGLATGAYNLVAVVDSSGLVTGDANRANNTVTSSGTIAVTKGYVDLSGTFGTLRTLPLSIAHGKALLGYASVVVKNIGNVALPAGQLVNIVLVAHDTTNGANPDITLLTLSNQSVSALAAGGARQFNAYVNWAAGLPSDDYQIEATIAPVNNLADFSANAFTVLTNALGNTLGITVI